MMSFIKALRFVDIRRRRERSAANQQGGMAKKLLAFVLFLLGTGISATSVVRASDASGVAEAMFADAIHFDYGTVAFSSDPAVRAAYGEAIKLARDSQTTALSGLWPCSATPGHNYALALSVKHSVRSRTEYQAVRSVVLDVVDMLLALEREHEAGSISRQAVAQVLSAMEWNDQLWGSLPLLLHQKGLPENVAGRLKKLSQIESSYFWAFAEARACDLQFKHSAVLRAIISEHGWVDHKRFGQQASSSAWLIAQHADFDLDLQLQVLSLMGKSLDDGGANKSHYAYLADRVSVNSGRPQIYGTQYRQSACGANEPVPIANPENLAARRQEMGLESMERYDREMRTPCQN